MGLLGYGYYNKNIIFFRNIVDILLSMLYYNLVCRSVRT